MPDSSWNHPPHQSVEMLSSVKPVPGTKKGEDGGRWSRRCWWGGCCLLMGQGTFTALTATLGWDVSPHFPPLLTLVLVTLSARASIAVPTLTSGSGKDNSGETLWLDFTMPRPIEVWPWPTWNSNAGIHSAACGATVPLTLAGDHRPVHTRPPTVPSFTTCDTG